MAFRLDDNQSAAEGLRRIVREQLDEAIEQLGRDDEYWNEVVHEVRKSFKRVRAILRLMRDELGEVYLRENACLRDAGRSLSGARDAQVLIETFDTLSDGPSEPLSSGIATGIRETLIKGQNVTGMSRPAQEQVATLITTLKRMQRRVRKWPITRSGWSALADGLKRIYRHGRVSLTTAYKEPTAENFHEWRKRVKDLWHHYQILEPIWSEVVSVQAEQAHALADLLGDDHDLSVLRERLVAASEEFGGHSNVAMAIELIDRRCAHLRWSAQLLGQRLYADRPGAFLRRNRTYWQAWKRQTGYCSGVADGVQLRIAGHA
ncbi:MAG: CHAD domain-containing protein [Gemmatimonadaceae bacterium]|nr:CHAD domain-containing protein [Gloeobacterales cyanobacterium ES-bin-141]